MNRFLRSVFRALFSRRRRGRCHAMALPPDAPGPTPHAGPVPVGRRRITTSGADFEEHLRQYGK